MEAGTEDSTWALELVDLQPGDVKRWQILSPSPSSWQLSLNSVAHNITATFLPDSPRMPCYPFPHEDRRFYCEEEIPQ
jgi:hypothetical protein